MTLHRTRPADMCGQVLEDIVTQTSFPSWRQVPLNDIGPRIDMDVDHVPSAAKTSGFQGCPAS